MKPVLVALALVAALALPGCKIVKTVAEAVAAAFSAQRRVSRTAAA